MVKGEGMMGVVVTVVMVMDDGMKVTGDGLLVMRQDGKRVLVKPYGEDSE